jgi:glycosyltransferase involved in cell wall biosynthesis
MVSDGKWVFIVSNDIVPSLGMPVAAPGLRAFGLAEGLRANGLRVKTIVTKGFVERQWMRFGKPIPHPTAPDTEIIGASRLARYLESHAPAVAILINSNQVDHLRPIKGVRFVLDFFAPKMLETLYHHGEGYPEDELKRLRERKIRAVQLADAFVVNGAKKVPYFLAWMLQADRDVRRLPLEVVNMCVPLSWPDNSEVVGGDAVRFAVAGYLQSWSTLGSWVEVLERRLDHPRVRLDLLVPWHWSRREHHHESKEDIDRIGRHASVTTHGPMTFSGFQGFLSTVDVTIDLFERNLEREYAMVTRSVVSLACGIPVIHPPFTEVSAMIAEYDAGWLVDPEDTGTLEAVFEEVVESPDTLRRKTKNARTLACDLLDPAEAVKPLVRIVEAW